MPGSAPTDPTAEAQAALLERLKRLAVVAERSSNAVVLADADRTVVWVNQAFTSMMGLVAQVCIGQRLAVLLERGNADPAAFAQFRNAIDSGHALKQEISLRSANGEPRWALMDMQPLRGDDGALTGWVTVATDLTDLRAQQRLLTLALDGAGLGTWQWEVSTGAMQCNDRLLELFGYPRSGLAMHISAWHAITHPDDLKLWTAAVKAQLRDASAPLRMSMRIRHGGGRWFWILLVGAVVDRSLQGDALRMAGVAMDVQAQKNLEQELRTAAHTDGLTQLPNRSAVLQTIELAMQRRKAEPGYHFAVLFMDFDRFKQVNDTLGHGVGDELLRQIAARLLHSLRPGDSLLHSSDFAHVAARIGGPSEADNPRLRAIVSKALGANMTRDVVNRAITRGAGGEDDKKLDELTYEGYGIGGVAVLVEAMTDNINRTVAEVRHAFSRNGGNLGTNGSVAYLFAKRGEISFAAGNDEDKIIEIALEAGADDVESDADGITVVTSPEAFGAVMDALASAGLKPENAEVTMKASTDAEIADIEQAEKLMKMIDMLEDLDDVQNVYTNANFSDAVMAALNA